MPGDSPLERWYSGQIDARIPQRTVFDRTLPDGTRTIGWTSGQESHVVWTIRQNGTATWWQEGWNDGRTDLSTVHNFSQTDLNLFKVWGTYSAGSFPYFPFTESDKEIADRTIREMQVADVLSLYYNLWVFTPPPCGGCGQLVPVNGVTPRAIYEPARSDLANPKVELFQYGILQNIWRIRTDLRKIRNPANGEIIDGLISPERFPSVPCRISCSRFDVIADVVISVLTLGLGAPAWASAVLNLVQAADTIRQMRDARSQAAAYREFANSVLLGYSVATGPRENTPETVLVDRATGVVGSGGTTVSPSSGGSSILPLILLALLAL